VSTLGSGWLIIVEVQDATLEEISKAIAVAARHRHNELLMVSNDTTKQNWPNTQQR